MKARALKAWDFFGHNRIAVGDVLEVLVLTHDRIAVRSNLGAYCGMLNRKDFKLIPEPGGAPAVQGRPEDKSND
jgi:hypothetical protein